MKLPVTGGCACGAIRYESTSEPLMMLNCHCRDCQRATGSAYAPAVLLPSNAFRITRGTPHYFATPSQAGGHHTRGFCANCGSRVLGSVIPDSPMIGVTAASLDDPSWFSPQMDIFVADAQPWDLLNPDLRHCEFYPPTDPQNPVVES